MVATRSRQARLLATGHSSTVQNLDNSDPERTLRAARRAARIADPAKSSRKRASEIKDGTAQVPANGRAQKSTADYDFQPTLESHDARPTPRDSIVAEPSVRPIATPAETGRHESLSDDKRSGSTDVERLPVAHYHDQPDVPHVERVNQEQDAQRDTDSITDRGLVEGRTTTISSVDLEGTERKVPEVVSQEATGTTAMGLSPPAAVSSGLTKTGTDRQDSGSNHPTTVPSSNEKRSCSSSEAFDGEEVVKRVRNDIGVASNSTIISMYGGGQASKIDDRNVAGGMGLDDKEQVKNQSTESALMPSLESRPATAEVLEAFNETILLWRRNDQDIPDAEQMLEFIREAGLSRSVLPLTKSLHFQQFYNTYVDALQTLLFRKTEPSEAEHILRLNAELHRTSFADDSHPRNLNSIMQVLEDAGRQKELLPLTNFTSLADVMRVYEDALHYIRARDVSEDPALVEFSDERSGSAPRQEVEHPGDIETLSQPPTLVDTRPLANAPPLPDDEDAEDSPFDGRKGFNQEDGHSDDELSSNADVFGEDTEAHDAVDYGDDPPSAGQPLEPEWSKAIRNDFDVDGNDKTLGICGDRTELATGGYGERYEVDRPGDNRPRSYDLADQNFLDN